MPKKQKSGLYRSKVKIGVDADGKDIVKWISGKTKPELERAKSEVKAYYIDGTGAEKDRLLGEYAQEWYRLRKAPFISPSTQNSYRSMLNLHVFPVFGQRNLRAIKATELQAWVNGFAGCSKSTITQAIAVMRGIFDAAAADKIVLRNPTEFIVRPLAEPPAEKRALTTDERLVFKRVMREHDEGLYLAAMYYTGMRPGEVRGLQWGDVDFAEALIHVQRDIDYASKDDPVGDLKTKSANRYVPLAHELREMLMPRRGLPNAFIFVGTCSGGPLAQATAERMWLRLMLACGQAVQIEHEKPLKKRDIRKEYKALITPHTMRHNFITMCWENGMDVLLVMKIVGHADYQTTMNIYTHLSRKHLDKAQYKMDEMFSGKEVAQKLHKLNGDSSVV